VQQSVIFDFIVLCAKITFDLPTQSLPLTKSKDLIIATAHLTTPVKLKVYLKQSNEKNLNSMCL